MAFTINGEEVHPLSLVGDEDPIVFTTTIGDKVYNFRRSALGPSANPNVAKRIRLIGPDGNPMNMSPELEAKLFETIADALNNRAVLPEVTVSTPDLKNFVGRYNIASNDALRVTGLRPQNTHLNKQAEEGAARRAAWARENPGLEAAGLIAGAAPLAVAATPAIVGGGELAYPILTNPYVDAGITSAFAGHGLNHTINEGIDGWGDAAITALELTPLGRLAKPLWNVGKEGLQYVAKAADNTARYVSPSYDLYRTIGETTPRISNRFISSDINNAGTEYTLFNLFGEPIGDGLIGDLEGTGRKMVEWVGSKNKAHKVSEDIYNIAVQDALASGNEGVESGTALLSPQKTLATTSKFPYKVIGEHEGHDVRLLTGTTLRPYPQRVSGRHWYEIKPRKEFEIKYNELTGDFEEVPIDNTVADNIPTIEWANVIKTPLIAVKNTTSDMPNIVRTVGDNGKIRLSLPSHTDNKPRQFVLEPAPTGDNKYYVHMRMWDDIENKIPASNVTNEEKQQLFDALYDELPEGAEILFPKSGPGYYGTRGTVAGLQRLARDSRFTPGTKGTLQYLDKDGKTVRIYEGTSFIKIPQITALNAASITPEQWNAAYRAAYEKGDKAEGQRLWDLWFRQLAKNNKLVGKNNFPVRLRHNTDSEPWNVYDESFFNSGTGDGGWFGKGLYTTGNSWGENAYGKNTMNLYGYMEEPAVVPPANIELDKLPENFTTGYIARDFFNQGISRENYIKNLSGDALEWYKEYPELISKAINNTEKADGIIVQREASKYYPFAPFDEVVLPKGTHIKSAEPFTLDDNRELINLTDRANFNINDLRYGLLPFLGLGAAGTLYGKLK